MSRIATISGSFLLGFDEMERVLDRASKASGNGYPPYNVERIPANGENSERLRLVLAVAGFTHEHLDVSIEGNQLLIRGRQSEEQQRKYLYRGIAARQFQRSFALADGIEVLGAELKDGLLTIDLVRPLSDRTVKKIDISTRGEKLDEQVRS